MSRDIRGWEPGMMTWIFKRTREQETQPQGQDATTRSKHHPHDRMVDAVVSVSFAIALVIMVAMFNVSYSAHAEQIGCASLACVRADQFIPWFEAWRMKREMRRDALLLDIRSRERVGSGSLIPAFDAHVPFMKVKAGVTPEPGTERFHPDFTLGVDTQLRTRHLEHWDPVMLLCDSRRCGELAALLLQEHGYSRVLVVVDDVPG
jgi:rhodanese-related sulfurtransferase